MSVDKQYLNALAEVDEIRSVEKAPTFVLHSNIARGIMKADVIINATPYQGRGQIVAVADTGFDKGNKTGDVHPAFVGRVLNLYARGKADAADPEYVDKHQNHLGGHGTHVCGSVLWDGLSPILGGKIQGTAPQAKLVMQALADANGDLQTGPDLKVIFAQPYDNDGARIHTNSWGIEFRGTQRQYTTNNDQRISTLLCGSTKI